MPGRGRACRGAASNCEVLSGLDELHAERCAEVGIAGPDDVVPAMAVGLVIEVWRNGPVEAMHGGRHGPTDAAMFAESTALHNDAVKALTAQNRGSALIEFEEHLLDRVRPWAGTRGKALKDLGRGHLGEYDRHVKDRINALLAIDRHTCASDPMQVYLIGRALTFGRNHKGMPGWAVVVDRIHVLLSNPEHPAWRGDGRGAQALAEMPPHVSSIDHLTDILRTEPFMLPVDVLEWLSNHLLYCAAPPYTGFADTSGKRSSKSG